jgi:hypothetical protein
MILEDYLTHPDRKTGAMNCKILAIIHAFKCLYRNSFKNATDRDGGLLQDAAPMQLAILSAMHFTAES